MTTDDKTLTEQIARVLNREGWTYEGVHEPGDYDECEDCRRAVDPIAAAVLPIIRKAERDAAREALDGLIAEEEESFLRLHTKGAVMSAEACSHARFSAEEYRDTHYPEDVTP